MSVRCRSLWTRLVRITSASINKSIPIPTVQKCNKNIIYVPYFMGFSLFTWLGFEKKISAEDELIQTIKHCILFIQRTEYIKAEQLLHIALRQAQQLQHALGITYIYDVMANLALEREQLDKANKLFVTVAQRIMADGASEDDFRIVHISVKLARISHLKKEYDTAQTGYDWCLQKLKDAVQRDPSDDKKKLLALAEDWYGRLFLDHKQYDQAVKLMISALNRMRELTQLEQEHIVLQMNDIGTVYDQLGKVDESIQYFKEAIELGRPLEMEYSGTLYVNLGRSYIKKSMLAEARKNCGQAWKLATLYKNNDIKVEAEQCIEQINSAT